MSGATGNVTIFVDNKAEDVPRLLVCRFKPTPRTGVVFVIRPDAQKALVVAINENDVLAWYSNGKHDCPTFPSESVPLEKALADVQQGSVVTPEMSPIRLKSQWKGVCQIDANSFVVGLVRKPNNYTQLELESNPAKGGWIWRVRRSENFHSKPALEAGFEKFFKDAVAAVEKAALPMVGEACAVKELYRRSALDAEYAQTHPIKPASVPKTNPATSFWADAQKRAAKATQAAEKEKAKSTKKADKPEPKPETESKRKPKVETTTTGASAGASGAASGTDTKGRSTPKSNGATDTSATDTSATNGTPKKERPTLAPAPNPVTLNRPVGAQPNPSPTSAAAPVTPQPGGPVPNPKLEAAFNQVMARFLD